MLSTQLFYSPCLQSIAHSLTCGFSGNVPLLHTSRYVTARDQPYQAFPHVSTASDKRWGEKAWVRGYQLCTGSVDSAFTNLPEVTSKSWLPMGGL